MTLRSFRGYFDDSGKVQDQPSMILGGFIGLSSQWEILEDAWRPLLIKHGIEYFRGAECEHGQGQFDKEAKPQWRNPRVRSDVRLEFVQAIVGAGLTGFVSGIVSADYKALTDAQKERTGPAFSVAAQTLLIMVKRWADERHIPERFPYNFESGSDGYTDFKEVFELVMKCETRRDNYRMESLATVGKDVVGAQAADLLAYEGGQCMSSVVLKNKKGFQRPAFVELDKRLVLESQYHNSDTIAEMLSHERFAYGCLKGVRT